MANLGVWNFKVHHYDCLNKSWWCVLLLELLSRFALRAKIRISNANTLGEKRQKMKEILTESNLQHSSNKKNKHHGQIINCISVLLPSAGVDKDGRWIKQAKLAS